ncbi:hypothetical protein EI94DRAFT_1276052 [Lactarius quietus]|nr:hypothetical protein EI94DRAFT_1276052 [Lactarius quietus]
MRMSEDRRGSGSVSQGVPGLAANLNHRLPLVHPNGDQDDGVSVGVVVERDPLPPLGVKLTCYRLLNVTTAILWAVPKAVLSYKNRSAAGTTLDLLAALCGVALYWVGLFEERRGKNWERFFQVDLAPSFGHSANVSLEELCRRYPFSAAYLPFSPLSLFVCSLPFFFLPRLGESDSIETIGGFISFGVLLVFYF